MSTNYYDITKKIIISVIVLILSAAVFSRGTAEETDTKMTEPEMKTASDMDGEVAVFAGGCFWGVEGVFERLKGVRDVVSGYSGGSADTAHYKIVGTGTTGHAESVRIVYDETEIDYKTLLEVFFTVAHDPTQLNYQGPDVGTEYRSAIFYSNPEQKKTAETFIAELDETGRFSAPIVTELNPLDAFYPAEDYHQDFMKYNPNHPYILYWDRPKIIHLEDAYPDLVKQE